jgi:hypothetical protein
MALFKFKAMRLPLGGRAAGVGAAVGASHRYRMQGDLNKNGTSLIINFEYVRLARVVYVRTY